MSLTLQEMKRLSSASSFTIHILFLLQLRSSDVSSKKNSDPALVNTLNVSAASFAFFQAYCLHNTHL